MLPPLLLLVLFLAPANPFFLAPQPALLHSALHSAPNTELTSNPPASPPAANLDSFTVPSILDGHPLTVYAPKTTPSTPSDRTPILLLHGRTWSALSVYNLEPSPTIESFPASFAAYTMDFRGFGATPCDESNFVSPSKCVADIDAVVTHLCGVHGVEKITIVGWSQGALTAQLYAQANPSKVDKLVLYASIYDPDLTYMRPSVFYTDTSFPRTLNTLTGALEDFTLPGTIDHETAMRFATLALKIDPVKAHWSQLHEFNLLSPAQIQNPTLVIAGALDPYCDQKNQAALFTRIPQNVDKTWVQLAGSDHAAHLLGCKNRWMEAVVAFIGQKEEDCGVELLGAGKGREYFEQHGLNI